MDKLGNLIMRRREVWTESRSSADFETFHSLGRAWIGYSFGVCGNRERFDQTVRELEACEAGQYMGPSVYWELYAGIGHVEAVLHALERSVQDRSPDAVDLPAMPDLFLEDIRREPRYRRLVEAMNNGSHVNPGGPPR